MPNDYNLTDTWTEQNVFNPRTVERTIGITRWERLRLFFHKKFLSIDVENDVITFTTFKRMKDKTYITDVDRYTSSTKLSEDVTNA